MRLDLAPTPMAPVAKKRKWLMYEMLRYKEGLSRMVTLKVLIGVGVACLIFSQLSFWLGMAVLWGGPPVIGLWISFDPCGSLCSVLYGLDSNMFC